MNQEETRIWTTETREGCWLWGTKTHLWFQFFSSGDQFFPLPTAPAIKNFWALMSTYHKESAKRCPNLLTDYTMLRKTCQNERKPVFNLRPCWEWRPVLFFSGGRRTWLRHCEQLCVPAPCLTLWRRHYRELIYHTSSIISFLVSPLLVPTWGSHSFLSFALGRLFWVVPVCDLAAHTVIFLTFQGIGNAGQPLNTPAASLCSSDCFRSLACSAEFISICWCAEVILIHHFFSNGNILGSGPSCIMLFLPSTKPVRSPSFLSFCVSKALWPSTSTLNDEL